jgi:hypothetical protein
MARGYYRMSSLRRLDSAVLWLLTDPQMTAARLLGYAHRHVLRIDHPDDRDPHLSLREIDPMVRVLPGPPTGASQWVAIGDFVPTP